MSTISTHDLRGFVAAATAPEVRLPDAEHLTFTRNFTMVVVLCGVMLCVVPVLAGLLGAALLH